MTEHGPPTLLEIIIDSDTVLSKTIKRRVQLTENRRQLRLNQAWPFVEESTIALSGLSTLHYLGQTTGCHCFLSTDFTKDFILVPPEHLSAWITDQLKQIRQNVEPSLTDSATDIFCRYFNFAQATRKALIELDPSIFECSKAPVTEKYSQGSEEKLQEKSMLAKLEVSSDRYWLCEWHTREYHGLTKPGLKDWVRMKFHHYDPPDLDMMVLGLDIQDLFDRFFEEYVVSKATEELIRQLMVEDEIGPIEII